MASQGLEKAESSSVPHRMSAFHPCGFRSAEAITGFDSTSPVGSGLKKPGLQHWEGASTRSCAPLSGADQLSLPPCAAGDSLPIFKINSLCILPSERNPPWQTRICRAWAEESSPSCADGLRHIWKGSVACEEFTHLQQRCFCQTRAGTASSDSAL